MVIVRTAPLFWIFPFQTGNEMKIDCRESTQKMCSKRHLMKILLACKDGYEWCKRNLWLLYKLAWPGVHGWSGNRAGIKRLVCMPVSNLTWSVCVKGKLPLAYRQKLSRLRKCTTRSVKKFITKRSNWLEIWLVIRLTLCWHYCAKLITILKWNKV